MAHELRPLPVFLVAIGGYPGTGKTTVAQQLSARFGVPRLSSDTLKRAIEASPAAPTYADATGWLTFDLLFTLTDELLQQRISVILDMNLGKSFHWRYLDSVRTRYPTVQVVPIVLRCAKALCLERIGKRYTRDPSYDPPETYLKEPAQLALWTFLEGLKRSDTRIVDAARAPTELAEAISQYLERRLESIERNAPDEVRHPRDAAP